MRGSKNTIVILTALCLAAFVGCQEPEVEPPPTLHQSDAISQCGGFNNGDEMDGAGGYCDAERLLWEYDSAAATLVVTDVRALLNCCGERELSIALVDGVYVITETDAPEGEGGRCDCLCVFDLELTVEGMPAEEIAVRFEREVTDEGGSVVLFDGSLDLGAGAGAEILSEEDAAPWCVDEEPDELSAPTDVADEVSQCGGFPEMREPRPDDDGEGDAYCDAERLSWQFDAATGTLELVDMRALLNCCGERTVTLDLVDGVYVATETDAPESEGGRCDCLCVFDLAVTATGLSAGTVPLRVVRHVTDESAPNTLYEGTLDLTVGSGEVVLSEEDASFWCESL